MKPTYGRGKFWHAVQIIAKPRQVEKGWLVLENDRYMSANKSTNFQPKRINRKKVRPKFLKIGISNFCLEYRRNDGLKFKKYKFLIVFDMK